MERDILRRIKKNSELVENRESKVGRTVSESSTEKKYELTDETVVHDGRTLHRIKALKDFGEIKSGDIGGWVESEDNLSQDGTCWISDSAKVFGRAHVYGDARVSDDAQVSDYAIVYDRAKVSDSAGVFNHAQVSDSARVSGFAQVYDDALVFGLAHVYGDTRVYDRAKVSGFAWVFDNAKVFGRAQVSGFAQVSGKAKVDYEVSSGKITESASRLYVGQVLREHRDVRDAKVSGDVRVTGHAKVSSPASVGRRWTVDEKMLYKIARMAHADGYGPTDSEFVKSAIRIIEGFIG